MEYTSELMYLPIVTVEQIVRFRKRALEIEKELYELRVRGIKNEI